MKILDSSFLNIMLVLVPPMVYLLYLAYTETVSKKENSLIFVLVIISEYYLIVKYGISLNNNMPLLIAMVPFLISCYKRSDRLVIIISILCMFYYISFYKTSLITLEYLLYFIIYKNEKNYINIVVFFKIIVTSFLSNDIMFSFIDGIFLFVLTYFIIYMLEKGEELLKIHLTLKNIKKDAQIKKSLFQITHEIKNPIAVCKGYLDMCDINNTEKMKRYVPIIKEEIDRTLILLEDFLALNKQKINKNIIDINLLLEEVTGNMNLLFKENNINLITKIPDEEEYIEGDYNRLTQVFINILKNSIEALEDKSNRMVEVWTINTKNNIKIYVKDNGIGMDKETLKKIKEPFYTTKQKGTGLGVSLSSEIISAHDGEINYMSEENKYTTVKITLPKKAI